MDLEKNTDHGTVGVNIKKVSDIEKTMLIVQKSNHKIHYNPHVNYLVLPLQFGNGTYYISLYRRVSEKKNLYSLLDKISLSVNMRDVNAYMLYPNYIVNYNQNMEVIQNITKLVEGCRTEKEKYGVIKKYIKEHFIYDYIYAIDRKRKQPFPSSIENCYKTKKGVCLDLATLATALFRSQGIKAQFVAGKADGSPHAWVYVYVDGQKILYDPTAALMQISIKKITYLKI